MKTLVVHAHPLEESYNTAIRDTVCDALEESRVDHTLIRLARGEEPDLVPGTYDRLVAVCPTWWGGPPAVLLDWLQRTLSPVIDAAGGTDRPTSPLTSVRHLTVVTTHGSSRLMNGLQGEPGRRTWARVVVPLCAPGARFDWVALYKIDRSTPEDRAAFLARVREAFTTAPVPA